MIFKDMDEKEPSITALERCLALAATDSKKKSAIEEEIRTLRAGIEGERDAAYHIDFHLKDRRNSGVIHDLRLELPDGRAAQID